MHACWYFVFCLHSAWMALFSGITGLCFCRCGSGKLWSLLERPSAAVFGGAIPTTGKCAACDSSPQQLNMYLFFLIIFSHHHQFHHVADLLRSMHTTSSFFQFMPFFTVFDCSFVCRMISFVRKITVYIRSLSLFM